jgi:hypothetical protein
VVRFLAYLGGFWTIAALIWLFLGIVDLNSIPVPNHKGGVYDLRQFQLAEDAAYEALWIPGGAALIGCAILIAAAIIFLLRPPHDELPKRSVENTRNSAETAASPKREVPDRSLNISEKPPSD